MKPFGSGQRPALSRTDVLVVTFIGVLVIGLILPAIRRSRNHDERNSCSFRLRQLGMAMLNYESVNGLFPPGLFPSPPGPLPGLTFVPDADDLQYGYQSGFTAVLPYVESENFGPINLNRPWFDADNGKIVSEPRKTFVCPSNRGKVDLINLSLLSQFLVDNGSLKGPLPQLAACDYLLCRGPMPP